MQFIIKAELWTMYEGRSMINHALCSYPLKSATLLEMHNCRAINEEINADICRVWKRMTLGRNGRITALLVSHQVQQMQIDVAVPPVLAVLRARAAVSICQKQSVQHTALSCQSCDPGTKANTSRVPEKTAKHRMTCRTHPSWLVRRDCRLLKDIQLVR